MKLVKTTGRTKAGNVVAVLDTPCYPCRYYAGLVIMTREGFIPKDNATSNFHRTEKEAVAAGKEVLRLCDAQAESL